MLKNFILRAMTGVLFVLVLVGAIIYSPLTFGILFTCIAVLAMYEYVKLVNTLPEVSVNKVVSMAGAFYLFPAFMAFTMDLCGASVFIPYLFILIYLLVSELYLNHAQPVANWGYVFFGQVYIALFLALLNVLAFQYDPVAEKIEYNWVLPLSLFIFLWLNDTGAYCVGVLFGKHCLFPRISPKKSWEGAIGGVVVALLASLAMSYWFSFMTVVQWAGFAMVVTLFGIWGDLVESLFKRQLEVKDSGNMLPGHGGILDRFDSSLLAIPAAVGYIYLISGF
ncbi:MAG: phosphatidate cytidylyltransferase [Bacteroides sp.]|nr:phosphatidate cytidylyltransferase [Bacteroides sp.]